MKTKGEIPLHRPVGEPTRHEGVDEVGMNCRRVLDGRFEDPPCQA